MSANTVRAASWKPRLKRVGYVSVGLLILAVFVMSFVQIWFIYFAPDLRAYGAIESDARGFPPSDDRGAFLMLNDQHSPDFPNNLIELLATNEPGVVDKNAGAHLKPSDLKAVLINSAILNEASDYRVYILGKSDQVKMTHERQTGGKVMIIKPENGTWEPGAYMVDIPAEGMFGGRTYFQFFID